MNVSRPLSFLVLSLSVLVPGPAAGQTTALTAPGSISLRADGRELTLTKPELAKLPRHEQVITAEGTRETDTVSGVSLWDLLQLARAPSPTAFRPPTRRHVRQIDGRRRTERGAGAR